MSERRKAKIFFRPDPHSPWMRWMPGNSEERVSHLLAMESKSFTIEEDEPGHFNDPAYMRNLLQLLTEKKYIKVYPGWVCDISY